MPKVCLKEFTKPNLRVTSQLTRIEGTFIKGLLKYSESYNSTVSLVTCLFKWRSPEEARNKARSYLLKFAAPSPVEISGLKRQYRVELWEGLVFATTRPYKDSEGNETSPDTPC